MKGTLLCSALFSSGTEQNDSFSDSLLLPKFAMNS